jgi:uncharacterized phage protein gp47/JayE
MATISLSDLLTPYTQSALRTDQYTVLSNAGFPVTSWADTSVPYVLAESNIACVLDLSNLVPQIAAGGLLELATGDWLTLLASQNYQLDRYAAKFTRRVLRLTNASGSQVSKSAGDVTVKTAENAEFSNDQAFVVDSGQSVFVVFKSLVAGADGDAATDSWSMVTSLAGVTVDELAGEPLIATAGADEESDAALRARCIERWSTLGAGANSDAYTYWIKNTPGCPETVTRVQIRSHYPLPGQVTAYAGTDTAPISDTATLGTVTQVGSGPAVTLSGTPLESIVGRVEIVAGGVRGVATFRVTTDGGDTWSDTQTTAATYAIGATGVTLNFAAGTYVINAAYSWTSTPATTDVIQNYIDPSTHLGLAPNCTDFFIEPCSSYTLAPVGVIYVRSAAYSAAISAARGTVIADLCASVDVGGTLYVESIRHALMSLSGVVNVTIATPASDVTLSAGQMAVSGSISGLTISVI